MCVEYMDRWTKPMKNSCCFTWMTFSDPPNWKRVQPYVQFLINKRIPTDNTKCFDQLKPSKKKIRGNAINGEEFTVIWHTVQFQRTFFYRSPARPEEQSTVTKQHPIHTSKKKDTLRTGDRVTRCVYIVYECEESLGAFGLSPNAPITFTMSVCPHGSALHPLDGFPSSIIMGLLWKSVRRIQIWLKLGKIATQTLSSTEMVFVLG